MNIISKIESFITALGKLTVKKVLKWETVPDYLDSTKNYHLKKYLIKNNRYIYSFENTPLIDEYGSYCTTVNGGQVYLFRFKTVTDVYRRKEKYHYVCAVQSSALSEIVTLTTEFGFQDQLSVLRSLIDQAMVKTDDFLSSVIELSNED